jgi:uncharacterized membrane protein YgdD (TMEM256/DUF423 family)
MNPNSQQIRLAALLGFLGVGLGAFGAHGLAEVLKSHDTVEIWKTASHYHLVHAVMLLLLAFVGGTGSAGRYAWWTMLGGVLIFSGTLYLLAVSGIRWLGAITPIGGLLLMIGWLLTAVRRWPRA